jgi:hypothetical protein
VDRATAGRDNFIPEMSGKFRNGQNLSKNPSSRKKQLT